MNENIQTKEEDNVLPFRKPIPAKPNNSDIIGYNWLADLPVSTVFLVRPRPKGMNKDIMCSLLHVGFHGQTVTHLLVEAEPKKLISSWCITREFSNANELVEVLYDPREQQDGHTEGEGNRPDTEQRVGEPSDGQGDRTGE